MGMGHGACSLLSALSNVTLPRPKDHNQSLTLSSAVWSVSSSTRGLVANPIPVRLLHPTAFISASVYHTRCAFQPTIHSSGASKGPRRSTRHCRETCLISPIRIVYLTKQMYTYVLPESKRLRIGVVVLRPTLTCANTLLSAAPVTSGYGPCLINLIKLSSSNQVYSKHPNIDQKLPLSQ